MPLGVNNDNIPIYNKGYNDHLSYFSIMFTPFSQPIKEYNRQMFLNLGSNIKHSYLLNKYRKDYITPQTSFWILLTNKNNSNAILNHHQSNELMGL